MQTVKGDNSLLNKHQRYSEKERAQIYDGADSVRFFDGRARHFHYDLRFNRYR